jgi:hypothetical protein
MVPQWIEAHPILITVLIALMVSKLVWTLQRRE